MNWENVIISANNLSHANSGIPLLIQTLMDGYIYNHYSIEWLETKESIYRSALPLFLFNQIVIAQITPSYVSKPSLQ